MYNFIFLHFKTHPLDSPLIFPYFLSFSRPPFSRKILLYVLFYNFSQRFSNPCYIYQTTTSFLIYFEKMDSRGFDNVKAEKESAMRRYRRHQKYKTFMRLLEFIGALVFLSCSPTYLPIAAKFLGDFFAPIFSHTYYAFLIGNAIVFSLICMSCRNGAAGKSRDDFYDEFVDNSEFRRRISSSAEIPMPKETPEAEEAEDKQIVSAENAVSSVTETVHETELAVSPINPITVSTVSEKALEVKRYRRTQSENFDGESIEKSRPELRRSETEKGREVVISGVESKSRSSAVVEEMSGEEFRMTIETFIARRKKIMMEEKRKDEKTVIALREQNRELVEKIGNLNLMH